MAAKAIASSRLTALIPAVTIALAGSNQRERLLDEDSDMTGKSATFPLRLPQSPRQAVEELAREDGTSMNQFVVTTLAEKLSAMKTGEFFAERRERADFDAFDRIMSRKGGQQPAPEDVL